MFTNVSRHTLHATHSSISDVRMTFDYSNNPYRIVYSPKDRSPRRGITCRLVGQSVTRMLASRRVALRQALVSHDKNTLFRFTQT